jgi:hypothetical protein
MPRPAPAAEPPARLGRRAPGAPRFALVALALAAPSALACSQSALVGRDTTLVQDAATPTYDLAPFDGAGFVDGHVHAHAVFNTVERVYWFDDPSSHSIVVYIFEDAPTCDDVSKNGWLTSPKVRPADLMGITVAGDKRGVYPVVPESPPSDGNAYLLHVIDQADPVRDSEGLSGTVTITDINPGQSVSGAFEATFSTGTLQGSFNAEPCPTGVSL